MEKERDFYFEKLHCIEALCEAPEYAHCRALADAVQAVLYHVRSMYCFKTILATGHFLAKPSYFDAAILTDDYP